LMSVMTAPKIGADRLVPKRYDSLELPEIGRYALLKIGR